MDGRREGFTLVELLIVIIIIAILVGLMLLTMGSATSTAEANKIVSDLRMLHVAALSYYLDNDGFDNVSPSGSPTPLPAVEIKSIGKYLDRDVDMTRYSEIYITKGPGAGSNKLLLGIKYGQTSGGALSVINEKLSQMASSAGLYDLDGNIFQPTPTTRIVCIWLK